MGKRRAGRRTPVSEGHHVIPQQRIKIARGRVAIKLKTRGIPALTDSERRLLDTPLHEILEDRRNIVRLSRERHHRAHNGFERLTRRQLPAGIHDFVREYALEAALDHELQLIDNDGRPAPHGLYEGEERA